MLGQIHGLHDQLIPFATAKWLHEMLSAFSEKVTFIPHGSGHDIPHHIPSTIAAFLGGAMNSIGAVER